MIIYLEGPDGSGKSTLLRNLKEVLQQKWLVDAYGNMRIPTHPARSGRVSEKTLYSELKKMANDKYKVYIVDRGPISDIVYRVFDDYSQVTTLSKLTEFMRNNSRGIYTIYCCSSKAEENMLKRGDDNPIALTKHKEITKVYNLVMNVLQSAVKYNIVTYDYNKRGDFNKIMQGAQYFCHMGMKGE